MRILTQKEKDTLAAIKIMKKLDEKNTVRILWTVQGMAMASGISAQEALKPKIKCK